MARKLYNPSTTVSVSIPDLGITLEPLGIVDLRFKDVNALTQSTNLEALLTSGDLQLSKTDNVGDGYFTPGAQLFNLVVNPISGPGTTTAGNVATYADEVGAQLSDSSVALSDLATLTDLNPYHKYDGSTVATGNWNMGGNKITNGAVATNPQDIPVFSQVPDKWVEYTTSGVEPSAGDLSDGEFAINLVDGKVWFGYNNQVYRYPAPSGEVGWVVTTTPSTNPGPYDAWMNNGNGLPYYYDPLRDLWLSLETVAFHFSKNANVKNAYLSIGDVDDSGTGFVPMYDCAIISISGSISGGTNTKTLEVHADNTSAGTFTLQGSNVYLDDAVNIQLTAGSAINIFVPGGTTITNPQFLMRVKWFVNPLA